MEWDQRGEKRSHHLRMQVFHFANLTHHSESGNVQLCVCVFVWHTGPSAMGVT